MRSINKKGQVFGPVLGLVAGIVALGFLIVFAFIWFSNLNTTALLGTNTLAKNSTDQLVGNFSNGVAQVNTQIPTIFTIAAFIAIVVVLVIAYAYARKSGLFGGGSLG